MERKPERFDKTCTGRSGGDGMEEEIEKTEVVETAVRAAEEAAEALGEKTLE